MKKQLRIGFISQGMGTIRPPSVRGSVAIWTFGVAQQLSKHGVDIILYEHGDSLWRSRTLHHEKIRITYLPTGVNRIIRKLIRRLTMKNTKNRQSSRVAFDSPLHNLGFMVLAALRTRRDRRNVVHVPNFSQAAPLFRSLHPRASFILHMHCEWLTELDPRIIRKRLGAVSAVISCSRYITGKTTARFPHAGTPMMTVYNGVDPERFKPAVSKPPSKRILFVGRISPEKGVHDLVNSFRRVAGQEPGASLELIGGRKNLPPEFIVGLSKDRRVSMLDRFYTHDYLDSVLHGLPDSVSERINVHGTIKHDRLPQWYRSATVLAMPSLSEAFGIPVIEAMAAGIPVVANRVGGLPELVVEGKTGYLIEPGDTDSFAEALLRILGSETLQKSMGARGRERVKQTFSWNVVTDSLLQVYSGVLTKAPIEPSAGGVVP